MIWNGLSIPTRNVYAREANDYVMFCRLAGFECWPASLRSLLEYIGVRAHGSENFKQLSPDTIQHHLSAIRSHHVDRNLPCDVFDNELLKRAMRGVKRVYAKPKKTRLPLGRKLIEKILSVRVDNPYQQHSLDTLNFFTALRVAYAGFMRLGEITYSDKDRATPAVFARNNVLRRDVKIFHYHATLHLRRSKGDREHVGITLRFARSGGIMCPVAALEALRDLDPQPDSAPLFRFVGRGFPRQLFVDKIRQYLILANEPVDHISGHSIRQGAAQDAHDLGFSRDEIQALGRWNSDSVDRYFNFSSSRHIRLSRELLTQRLGPHNKVRFQVD